MDLETFSPVHRSQAWRQGLGFAEDDVIVLNVGRLGPEKGIGTLLDAWEQLGSIRHRARLVFVGAGMMEPEIARRDLPDVHMLGVRHGSQLSAAYASADLFVLPSATETFGNVLLEAMASGLPSVVVAAGGPTELAVHGESAWFVPPNDAAGMSQGLARLIAGRELRSRLAREARATAVRHSWPSACDALLSAYREAHNASLARRAA